MLTILHHFQINCSRDWCWARILPLRVLTCFFLLFIYTPWLAVDILHVAFVFLTVHIQMTRFHTWCAGWHHRLWIPMVWNDIKGYAQHQNKSQRNFFRGKLVLTEEGRWVNLLYPLFIPKTTSWCFPLDLMWVVVSLTFSFIFPCCTPNFGELAKHTWLYSALPLHISCELEVRGRMHNKSMIKVTLDLAGKFNIFGVF